MPVFIQQGKSAFLITVVWDCIQHIYFCIIFLKWKIIHEFNLQVKDGSTFDALRKCAELVKETGGQFSAKDFSDFLKVVAVAIFNADQKKEFDSVVARLRERVQTELKEALERAERAEDVASHEYERARDEVVKELRYYKEKMEECQDKAEELYNLENNVHPEIWNAVCGMLPGDRLTFSQAYEVAEKIRNCGRFDASQLKMAI